MINKSMIRRSGKLVPLVTVLALVGAFLASSSAGATARTVGSRPVAAAPLPPAAHATTVATAAASTASAKAIHAYWTAARMAAAKPADVALQGHNVSAAAAGNTATGAPGTGGGYVPAGLGAVSGFSSSGPSTSNATVNLADGSYPGPNTTFDWYPKYRVFPVSTIGKLFFTEPSGNFVCSAASTYGGGTLNMVWTAGHCVGPQGGQAYYSNWLFCPSYLEPGNENPAVGCWSWSLAQQTGGWYFNGAFDSDYAYLYMQSSGDILHESVVSATGGLGFAWNWGRDQHWFDFGYPAASPYDGNAVVVTAAEHRYDVTNPDGGASTTQDNSMGSAQTPGFSGGPWILHFGGTGSDPQNPSNWINSDNSYYFTSGGPGGGNEFGVEIQGPYYNTAACNFWKGGSGYTGTC